MSKRYFGFDPEFFVQHRNAKDVATSVHLIPDPEKFDGFKDSDDLGLEKKVWFKTDGWALEANSVAERCRDYVIPSTAAAMRRFYRELPDYKLSAVPVMKLNSASLKGDTPLGVKEFGCLPDMDAYDLVEKTPFRSDYHDRTRYAGGHLHFAYNNGLIYGGTRESEWLQTVEDRNTFNAAWAIHLDVYFTIPLISMLGSVNDYGEAERRTYYGQAGSYRNKEYGIEYRVPSSAIMMSPILLAWVIGKARNITPAPKGWEGNMGFITGNTAALLKRLDRKRIQDIINGHDVAEARKFIKAFSILEEFSFHNDFYELMVKADARGIRLEPNLFRAWNLGETIANHRWMGVSNVMSRSSLVKHEWKSDFFPPIELVEEQVSPW